ncbi:unnamed protein product [Owenia fusiformis]|uniref:protein-tyrosine-phosphatase n=1 Tax=Owenia fusiformis TaxID=6347 RepID=A0A8J1XV74_OWEFU|nr:unnamed protein product [Owenia fusiformis]
MVILGTNEPSMSGFDSSDDENEGEVDLSPFKIDWLDLSYLGLVEPLGISALPGCRFKDVWRNLEADIESIKSLEISDVFCFCSRGELHKYRVTWLLQEYTKADITTYHYPFPDGCTPTIGNLVKMLEQLKLNLMEGKKSLIHCFGGLGRACLVACCFLLYMDPTCTPEVAIAKVQQIRGPRAIQSVKQYNQIHDFRKDYEKYSTQHGEAFRSVSR